MTKTIKPVSTGISPRATISFRDKLMLAASAGMIAVAAPVTGLYGGRAVAQALPDGCVDDIELASENDGDGNFDNGETIQCVSEPAGQPIDPIGFLAERINVIIGDDLATPTKVQGGDSDDAAIFLLTGTDQSLTINEGAEVALVKNAFRDAAAPDEYAVTMISSDGDVTLTNNGVIRGEEDAAVFRSAIFAFVDGAGNNLTIDSSEGDIFGNVYAIHSGSGGGGGEIDIKIGSLTSTELNGMPVLLGFAAGSSVADLDSGASHGEVDGLHLGAFANIQSDALSLAAAVSHAWQDYDFERAIVFGNGPIVAASATEGTALSLTSEAYYDLFWSSEAEENSTRFGAGPLLTFDHSAGSLEGFSESGAGLLNLTYLGETAQTSVFGAGAATHYSMSAFGGMQVDAGLRVTWENVSGDTEIEMLALLDLPGGRFRPNSARLDNNRAAIGFDAKVDFTDTVFGYIRYDTARSDEFTSQEGWAGVTVKF